MLRERPRHRHGRSALEAQSLLHGQAGCRADARSFTGTKTGWPGLPSKGSGKSGGRASWEKPGGSAVQPCLAPSLCLGMLGSAQLTLLPMLARGTQLRGSFQAGQQHPWASGPEHRESSSCLHLRGLGPQRQGWAFPLPCRDTASTEGEAFTPGLSTKWTSYRSAFEQLGLS